ncbi:methyltransferase [Actinacidiphila acididurans]|uniref:Methyltransferase n=1 Tax=Actinacidiphila acididurans TaxID=2784346 RepID=A0ABS2U561_9ACTN|nr:methyltransferase [Actinacidiphila acididurans]MBM9509846.1 methyltransferase [Actinacidiphila acididurans]
MTASRAAREPAAPDTPHDHADKRQPGLADRAAVTASGAAPEPAAPDTPDDHADKHQPGLADRAALFSVLTGGWLAQACYAITELGVPDLLAAGPRDADELAAACGADARALHRTLGALAAAGLLRRTGPRAYALTPVTRLLCSDTPRSARDTALMFGEEVHGAFGGIRHTLRTGRPAFPELAGASFYDYLGDHPQAAATFQAAMGTAAVPAALALCDLAGVRSLVDVGGGDGALLAAVLARHPEARGTLVELPQSIGPARARLTAAGCADRVDFAPGSFFEPGAVPAGADVYTLSRVLHNWDDERAGALLRVIRQAIGPDGRLLVLERLEDDGPPGGSPTARPGAAEARAKLIDLLMLVMVEGYDRTLEQYEKLLAAAGFAVRAVHTAPLRGAHAERAIEAVPVAAG